MMLSNELRSILDQAGQSFRLGHKPDSSNVQLLLCGDFNSLPDSGKGSIIRYFFARDISNFKAVCILLTLTLRRRTGADNHTWEYYNEACMYR